MNEAWSTGSADRREYRKAHTKSLRARRPEGGPKDRRTLPPRAIPVASWGW